MTARVPRNHIFPTLAIILAALFVYAPALEGKWLWDDTLLVTGNARLHSLAGLGQIWFAAPTTDYWPLSWTLLWLEWHLWGDAPLGYHLVSLALHVASAFLLWRILSRLGLRHGWIGALLFAVHPLAVESVAWISEIKNTLSLPLFLLAFDAWIEADESRPGAYPRSLAFYLLALLAKTSTIMLPAVLALYCWWRHGRITPGQMLRLAPYLAIALVLGAVTLHCQNHSTGLPSTEPTSLAARLLLAGIAACFYLGKFLLPFDLLTIYPAWPLNPPTLPQILALPALILLIVLLVLARREWTRHALFGLGFFLLTALPILGLADMQWRQFSPVANHLIYLPMLGLLGLVTAATEGVLHRLPEAALPSARAVLVIAFVALTLVSRASARLYADPLELWSYTLERNPDSWTALTGIGNALLDAGQPRAALLPLERAVRLQPDFAQARYDLANALLALGQTADAIAEYQRALALNPRDAQAHYNLANALLQTGDIPDALAHYEAALRLIPNSAEIRGNDAQALMRAGRTAEALAQFQQAAQLDPGNPITTYNYGVALAQTGQTAAAVAQLQRALQLDPHFTPALQLLRRLQPPKN